MMTYQQLNGLRTSLHTASNAAQRVTIAVDAVLPLLPPEDAERLTNAMRAANKLLDEAKVMAAKAFEGQPEPLLFPIAVTDADIERSLGEVP